MSVSMTERLRLDAARTVEEIAAALRQQVGQVLRRSGMVVAMSGGVDSSVCAGLAVRAVGPGRVLGLALPERESDGESLVLAREWAAQLGIELVVEDLTAALAASGCYARRDAAIRRVTPYGEGWRCKLVMENGGLESDRLTVGFLVVRAPDGEITKVRLPAVTSTAEARWFSGAGDDVWPLLLLLPPPPQAPPTANASPTATARHPELRLTHSPLPIEAVPTS